jgi:hypothetical protein
MPDNSRTLLGTLLRNQDVIKQELLFRADDPYFGVSTDVTYSHAYGLSAETLETYVNSLKFNHYDKRLILGNVKTAQALDETGNVLYEVVYSEIIDNLKNVSKSVSTEAGTVYPNSLDNMQTQVISEVAQVSARLPTWMLSKQSDGSVLGFVPAWVIAYTLPGQSSTLAYDINAYFKTQFNKLDFVADRYTIKGQFVENWDSEDQQWYPTDSTTFDIEVSETIFDKRSCIFVGVRTNKADITTKTADTINITADNGSKGTGTTHQVTNEYDKYLMFPNKDIINTKINNIN